jgi:hypothetical protein
MTGQTGQGTKIEVAASRQPAPMQVMTMKNIGLPRCLIEDVPGCRETKVVFAERTLDPSPWISDAVIQPATQLPQAAHSTFEPQ